MRETKQTKRWHRKKKENIVDNQLKLLAKMRGRWSAARFCKNPNTERNMKINCILKRLHNQLKICSSKNIFKYVKVIQITKITYKKEYFKG